MVPDNTTPLVPSVGITVNDDPLHALAVIFVIEEAGFTVTVTVKVFPIKAPTLGVIVYVAVAERLLHL